MVLLGCSCLSSSNILWMFPSDFIKKSLHFLKYLFEQWKANWNYRNTRLNQFTKVAFYNIDKQRCIFFEKKKNWSIPWLNFPHGLETHQHHCGKEVINQSSYSITLTNCVVVNSFKDQFDRIFILCTTWWQKIHTIHT